MTPIKRAEAAFRRTHYLVSTRFQLRYVGTILLMMFFTAAVCSYTVYYSIIITMSEKLSGIYPQGRLLAMIMSVNYKIMGNVLILAVVVGLIALWVSHKIAGPIYRIEKHLTEMGDGNFSVLLSLRQGDELQGVVNRINKLAENLRVTVLNEKASLDKMRIELDMINAVLSCKPGETPKINDNVTTLNTELKVLAQELEKYQV